MFLHALRYTCIFVPRETKARESKQEGTLPALGGVDRPEGTGSVTETATLEGTEATPTTASAAATTSQTALDALLRDILPRQGHWSDEAYLWLTDHGRRRIEFTDGRVEELPLPTFTRRAVLAFLYRLFHGHLLARGGVVVFSGLRMRIREGKFREPDLLLLLDRSDPRCQNRYWLGADLVAEVVSPEYWLVDPRDETITVLVLDGESYVACGVHTRGDKAASPLLDGFAADVAAVFDAPESGA